MALDLDFLTQIINVNWSGAVFVYAEQLGNKLYYVKPSGQAGEKPTIRTITLPEPSATDGHGDLFGVLGSSYVMVHKDDDDKGTPTFLICGTRSVPHNISDNLGNTVRVFDWHALIYLSNDGISWREARHQTEIVSDYNYQPSVVSVALVWNPKDKSFYYDQHFSSISPDTSDFSSKDQIFKSSNGSSWTNSSSTETMSAPDFKSTFPSFCVSNDCKDELGQNVPDGVMATDSQGNNTAKPTSPPTIRYGTGFIGYTPGENTVRVKRTTTDKSVEEYTTSIPEIGCITCVAGDGNILMAGGSVDKNDVNSGGVVVLSTDAGKTWKKIGTTDTGVVTMIAAAP